MEFYPKSKMDGFKIVNLCGGHQCLQYPKTFGSAFRRKPKRLCASWLNQHSIQKKIYDFHFIFRQGMEITPVITIDLKIFTRP